MDGFNKILTYKEFIPIADIFFSKRTPPQSINKIYGHITGETNFFKSKSDKQLDIDLGKCGISAHTGDMIFHEDFIKNIENNKCPDAINDEILFIFMEKGDGILSDFVNKLKTNNDKLKTDKIKEARILDGEYFLERLRFANKFLLDMKEALEFIHKLDRVHNDIKPQNIVYKMVENNKCPQFQSIDFGLLTKNDTKRTGGTLNYYYRTNFEKKVSKEYDWFCVACSLLISLGICKYSNKTDITCGGYNIKKLYFTYQ